MPCQYCLKWIWKKTREYYRPQIVRFSRVFSLLKPLIKLLLFFYFFTLFYFYIVKAGKKKRERERRRRKEKKKRRKEEKRRGFPSLKLGGLSWAACCGVAPHPHMPLPISIACHEGWLSLVDFCKCSPSWGSPSRSVACHEGSPSYRCLPWV